MVTAIELAQICAGLAAEKKADNILLLDVSTLSSYTDHLVICSASSERQVQAVAKHVLNALKEMGKRPLATEGQEVGQWILADLGEVILHIFVEGARLYYDLEGFWSDAKQIPVLERATPAFAMHQAS